jgi:hypothetical protein
MAHDWLACIFHGQCLTPNIAFLCCMAMEKLPSSQKLDVNLTKWEDHENEVMITWHMPGWHESTMINVLTKHGANRLYDNGESEHITNTRCKLNEANRPWKCDQVHVPCTIHDQKWTNYGKIKIYSNGQTDLITKT